MKYSMIRSAGNIKRYHTVQIIGEQTVAAHSFNVAMLCKAIEPNCSMNLLMAALTHDLAEIETGDIPATTKWYHKKLADELAEIETAFEEVHELYFQLTKEERDTLKIADMLELIFFCDEQRKLGNENMLVIMNRGVEYLKRFQLNGAAKELLEQLLTGAK